MDLSAWNAFDDYLSRAALRLGPDERAGLARGAEWLARASSASGLSQYNSPEDALLRAMGPGLAYFRACGTPRSGRMVDIGAGNGAIGATIGFLCRTLEVDLVDRAKRAYTISEVLVARLGLTNVTAVQGAAEELATCYDAVVFRAVAPACDALPLAASVLKPDGVICAFHRQGDASFERPEVPFGALNTYETLVDDLVMTCYRTK